MVHFRVFIFGVFFCIAHAQEPEIVNDILPEVQRVGRTGRLNCTVARLGGNSVQWSFPSNKTGEEIISINQEIKVSNAPERGHRQYEVKKYINVDRITFQLVIRRLRPRLGGIYICTIIIPNKPASNWNRKAGTLTVQYPPYMKPGGTETVKLVDKGSNDSIRCNAEGVPSPNITWVRSDGKQLPNGKAMFRGHVLPIISAQVNYAGVYRCIADNNIKPPAESLTQVYVFQQPTVRVLQDSVGQRANGRDRAKMDCIVQGYPKPTVSWYRLVGGNYTLVTINEKYSIQKQATDNQNLMNGEQWYTLTVLFVQDGDYTDYICEAKNSKGKGRAKITLFSTFRCQGPLCESLDPEDSCYFLRAQTFLILIIAFFTYIV